MPDQWYAVINSETGEAVSFGTVVDAPDGYEAIAVTMPQEGERWDAESRTFVSAPGKPHAGHFIAGVIGMMGVKRARKLDRDYGTWDALGNESATGYMLALAGIEEMLLEEDITQEEYDGIQAAWSGANLPRPQ